LKNSSAEKIYTVELFLKVPGFCSGDIFNITVSLYVFNMKIFVIQMIFMLAATAVSP